MMTRVIICSITVGVIMFFFKTLRAQDQELPTVEHPILIDFKPMVNEIAPGQKSALLITFKIPKYMWMGAQPDQARTPAGTRIKFQVNKFFEFGQPLYPEPSVEGVPVRVGVTRVYQGEVTVVVPFVALKDIQPAEYEITTLLTYTPGFNAGKLATHVDEPYSATIKITSGARSPTDIPEPKVKPVPKSFTVMPKPWNMPELLKPMFFIHGENRWLTKFLHTLYLDPKEHNKRVSQVTYPYIASTPQTGNSFGLGMAILNTTPEGVMTGAISLLAYHNEFVGAVGGFDMITCPAAYHNLRIKTRFSNDYNELDLKYENFLLGKNDRFGLQADVNLLTDPRFLFFGIGAEQQEESATVYDHEEIRGVLDFYYMPLQKLRIGLGGKIRNVEIDQGRNDISGDRFNIEGDIPLINSNPAFDALPGNTGSTIVAGRFNVIFDGRNQEFNPTKGLFGKFTAEFNSVTDKNNAPIEDRYGKFIIDLRNYYSTVDQKLLLLFRNSWELLTERNVPFYELSSLGGPSSIRAFAINRFRDKHSMFASMEMRYVVAKMSIMGFPMAIMMGAFLDAGQVFTVFSDFDSDFNWAPGVTLRMVNYPNVGYILNLATGQDGVNVTGGITLPF